MTREEVEKRGNRLLLSSSADCVFCRFREVPLSPENTAIAGFVLGQASIDADIHACSKCADFLAVAIQDFNAQRPIIVEG